MHAGNIGAREDFVLGDALGAVLSRSLFRQVRAPRDHVHVEGMRDARNPGAEDTLHLASNVPAPILGQPSAKPVR